MTKRLAELISYVFHPLLLSTILLVVLFFFSPNALRPITEANFMPILAVVFALTFFIPAVSIGMLKMTSTITSFKLEDRRERIMPFIFISLYYGLAVYMFGYQLGLGQTMVILFGTVTAVVVLITIITFFYKISVHSAGIWGVLGSMVAIQNKYPDSLLFWPIIITLLLAGMVNSARLYLSAHSSGQVNWGALLGFLVCFISVYLFS
ncbi:MAG: PA-phosphatase [Bacteroidota bacterium]